MDIFCSQLIYSNCKTDSQFTLYFEFSNSFLAILEKQAKIFGLSVDEYLRGLLPKTEKELPLEKDENDFEADMIAFAEGVNNFGYDGSYSREDIYFDHD